MLLCCRMCPIFQVSNVSGENLDLLRMFLNLLTTRMPCDYTAPAEFQIDETFAVPVCLKCPVFSIVVLPETHLSDQIRSRYTSCDRHADVMLGSIARQVATSSKCEALTKLANRRHKFCCVSKCPAAVPITFIP